MTPGCTGFCSRIPEKVLTAYHGTVRNNRNALSRGADERRVDNDVSHESQDHCQGHFDGGLNGRRRVHLYEPVSISGAKTFRGKTKAIA